MCFNRNLQAIAITCRRQSTSWQRLSRSELVTGKQAAAVLDITSIRSPMYIEKSGGNMNSADLVCDIVPYTATQLFLCLVRPCKP
jgi:hypothetical protein